MKNNLNAKKIDRYLMIFLNIKEGFLMIKFVEVFLLVSFINIMAVETNEEKEILAQEILKNQNLKVERVIVPSQQNSGEDTNRFKEELESFSLKEKIYSRSRNFCLILFCLPYYCCSEKICCK
ncbi:MAG: hypothetical protein WDZ41_05260 [Candidatus Babeliales bacterium]